MSVVVRKVDNAYGFWISNVCEFYNPEQYRFDKEKIDNCIKEFGGYPEEEKSYKYEDLIWDLTQSSGDLIVYADSEKTIELIEFIIGSLLN